MEEEQEEEGLRQCLGVEGWWRGFGVECMEGGVVTDGV